jgi:ribosomal protein S4
MNNSFIKVNSEVYSSIVLKFGSTKMRPYKYSVKLEKGLKINIKPSVANNSVTISINNANVVISTKQYDHLAIILGNNDNKRYLSHSLNMNNVVTLVIHKSFSGNKVSRTNYQQDPIIMKKGKYRYRSKAFWMKRTDLPRGKYSRDQRFKALTDLHVDAKVNRSYNFKHHSMKFLAWKLSMTINELQTQLKVFRMIAGNTTTGFPTWLNSRLVHVLVLAGFNSSYTTANQAIRAGVVLINGAVVKNRNTSVVVGDLITISTFTVAQESNISGLLIDYHKGSIFVQAVQNVLADVADHLYKEIFGGEISSFMLNPMNHWLHYTAPVLVRGFNR